MIALANLSFADDSKLILRGGSHSWIVEYHFYDNGMGLHYDIAKPIHKNAMNNNFIKIKVFNWSYSKENSKDIVFDEGDGKIIKLVKADKQANLPLGLYFQVEHPFMVVEESLMIKNVTDLLQGYYPDVGQVLEGEWTRHKQFPKK